MKRSKRSTLAAAGVLCTGLAFAQAQTAFEQGVMRGFPPAEAGQVTRANWMAPPFNRWAYQHTRQIHPSSGFPRATAQPAERLVGYSRHGREHQAVGQIVRTDAHVGDKGAFLRVKVS